MSDEDSRRSLAELFKPFAAGVLSDVLATKKPSKHHSKASSTSSSNNASPSVKRQSTSGAIGKISPNSTGGHVRVIPSSPSTGKEHSHGRMERERSNSLPPLPLWEVSKATGSAPDLLGPAVKLSKPDAIAVSTTSSSGTSSKTPSNQNSPKSAQTSDLTLSSSSDTRELSSSNTSNINSAPMSAPISQSTSRSYTEREKLMHPDAEQTVYRSPRKSDGKMVIVAAPFEQLLAALTDETAHDKDMLEQFLLTHSYFIETVQLLDRLLEKFITASTAPTHSGTPAQSSESAGSPRMQGIHVQLKLINIMKKWIELHVDDFDEPPTLAHLHKTLSAMAAASPTAAEWVQHLSSQLSKQQQLRSIHRLPPDTPGRPKPQFPKSSSKHPDDLSLLDINPVEFARQLTLYEHERFQRIPLRDYFRKGWSRAASDNSSEVCLLIEQFNRVSFWVASEIVTMPNHKHRTAVIARFIEIGQALQELGNFNGLMEVISGLNLHVVQRLKQSWKSVSAKHVQAFAQMNEFMDPKCNWQTYRSNLCSHSFPLLPFQGLHLTDLTFIEEMPDRMPNGVINFEKMSQLGKIFQEIRRCQAVPHDSKFLRIASRVVNSLTASWSHITTTGLQAKLLNPSLYEMKQQVHQPFIVLPSVGSHIRRQKKNYNLQHETAVSLLRQLSSESNPHCALSDSFPGNTGTNVPPQMLPLEAIWKWLWQNFTPSEVKTETISRDGLVEEVLSLPESAKTPKNLKQIHNLIVTFIYRYLQTLFPNHSALGYCDDKRQLFYLRRATAAEKAERVKAIPTFPEDLRLRLAKELREEMLGRRSATNLLSLGGPSSGGDNPATAPALLAGVQTDTRLPEMLQRSRSAAAAAAALGVAAGTDATKPSNMLKRSGTEADHAANADTRKKQRRKDEGYASAGEDVVGADVPAGEPIDEGPTEVLTTPLSPTPSGGQNSTNLTSGTVQGELGMMRAKQLAMQREIYDLRAELQRRDRAMHRELAALRMELDAVRAEMPTKVKVGTGVVTLPQLSPSAIKVPVPAKQPTAPAAATTNASSTTSSIVSLIEPKQSTTSSNGTSAKPT